MKRVRRLIENLARLQCTNWPLVYLYLVGPFENVTYGMTAWMPVRRAAVARIAFRKSNRQSAARNILHDAIEQFSTSLAGCGRLRERWHD
ncbi:MAG TPA: hypothetical protein VGJ68_13150, partial [Bradyrhizobium sp.]